MDLRWLEGVVDVRCPVCGRVSSQERLAVADVDWRDEPVEIARCGDCGAVVMGAVLPPSRYTESNWDWYVEHIAGLEAIDAALAKVGAGAGARVLDIGCGYGFSLDMACTRFGWQGIGLDPSIAAERGRRELGLDIRGGTLGDAFEPEERFDVILAIEVLEHVADPRAFLASVLRRLASDGVLLLSTPDASVVRPETPMTALYPTLSVGGHEFLVDEDGLRRLLEGAGFVADVRREATTLWGFGARSADALRSMHPDVSTDMLGLVDYCEARGDTAPAGSALALGMATRHLKFATAANAYRRAVSGLPRLRTALRERYDIDLDDPMGVLTLEDPPAVLVVVHFYAGILALLHDSAPVRAADHFAAAASVAKYQFTRFGEYRDPETPALEVQARSWRVNALAGCAPDAVPAAIDDLEEAIERTGADPTGVAHLRTLPTRRLAVRGPRRVRLELGRRKRAAENRLTHWRRRARQRGAHRQSYRRLTRGRSSSGRPASGAEPSGAAPSG